MGILDFARVKQADNLRDLYAFEQPQFTLSGTPVKPIKKGLPKDVESICPECSKVIPGVLYPENGKVMLKKECKEHGEFVDVFYGDVELYLKMERFHFGDQKGILNPPVPNAKVCPLQCGLCNMHLSHSALPIIDITNRCNLTCPVCFAHANEAGFLYEVTLEQVKYMLETLLSQQPVPADRIQISGGEPTIHPQFLEIVKLIKSMNFDYIQLNTNGIKMADLEFAQQVKEAGVDTLYLQFDGLKPETYQKIRGDASVLEKKLQTIENCRKVGITIVFVPTIVGGINNHEVGDILKFAIKNHDVVTGIAYQPVAITGRINRKQREKMRYTQADLAYDLKEQTGIIEPMRDWLPLASLTPLSKLAAALKGKPTLTVSSHPHCSGGTYIFIDPEGEGHPVGKFIDCEGMLKEADKLAREIKPTRFKFISEAKAFHALKKYFKQEKAPEGLTFEVFLKSFDSYSNKAVRKSNTGLKEHGYPTVFAAAMHFMDSYNYVVERVMRCVIHYVTPSGHLYPFCAYNSGPCFRDRVEAKFKLSEEETKKLIIKENYPKELRKLAQKLGLNVPEEKVS